MRCWPAAAATSASHGKKSVVAAFYPLAYAAERIGGPSLDVENLTPAGAEPHDLELTPRDRRAGSQSADVVLYLGHGFQPAVTEAADADARETRVDVLAGLPLHGRAIRTSGSTPCCSRTSCSGSARRCTAPPTRLVADLRRLDRAVPRRTARLRAGTRSSRATKRSATSHAVTACARWRSPGSRPRPSRSPQQLAHVVEVVRRTQADDGLLRAARLAAPGRHGRARGRRAHGGARPDRGPTPTSRARPDYFTLMQHNLLGLRKALGCR